MSPPHALPPTVVAEIVTLDPVALSTALGSAGLWTGEGPPGVIVGADVGDEYLDTMTGNLYRLDP